MTNHLRAPEDRADAPAPRRGGPVVREAVERLTWLGHATVLLELGGARLLTDPLLRDRVGHLRRQSASPDPAALEDLDAVLVSHLHLDHLDVASLRRLRRDVAVLAPAGAGRLLRRAGFPRATELRIGDRAEVAGVEVAAVPAVHDGRRHPLAPMAEAMGFVVTGARRVYFAGDTDVFEGMAEATGALDAALLPVWGWGPSLGAGHMDPAAAARAVALLRPRVAVPIHWGTFFPVGLERIRGAALVEPPREFARRAHDLAPDVEVRVLEPGQSLSLEPA
jgi:L-ascorbate metabolism protein UlaG (beta-lactamase superfamily)